MVDMCLGDVGAPGHNHLAEGQLILGKVVVRNQDGEDEHPSAEQQQHQNDGKQGHGRAHKCVLHHTTFGQH